MDKFTIIANSVKDRNFVVSHRIAEYLRNNGKECLMLQDMGEEQNASYILIGPGRGGSSDPWLGIPVLWSDISEARMIVECAIPGFRIEPSQGTHFFQNITSLGIGYLNIDTVISPDSLDESAFLEMEIEEQTDYVTVYRSPKDIIAFIDRNTSRAVAGI